MNGLVMNELAHLAEQEHMRASLEREAMRAAADKSGHNRNGGRGLAALVATVARGFRSATRWMAWPAADSGATSPVLHAGARREAR